MKNILLPTALLAAAAIVPAFAATPTSGEAQNQPAPKTEMSIAALQQMQKTIVNDEPIIEELHLDAGWLEDLPPDEQFRDIAGAINKTFTTQQDRRNAIGKVFGEEYVDTMEGTLESPEATKNVENMLGEAHKLFLSYENRNDVVDWGWGDAWGFTVTPNVGTLGIGIQVGYEFNKYFKVRAHYATGELDTTVKLSDTDIDLEWKNRDNMGLFFDWHPRASQFRVTAGLIRMDPRIKASAKYHGTTNATYDTGTTTNFPAPGATFGYAQYDVYTDYNMTGDWDNEFCPYIGIGWSTDGGQKRTLYFSIDLGLAYLGEGNYAESGSPSFYMTPVNPQTGQALGPTKHVHQSDLQHTDALATLQQFDNNVRDAVDKIADFLNDMYVYPVIQFGGGIRF